MVLVSMSGNLKPGIDLWEVASMAHATSAAGNGMFDMQLRRVRKVNETMRHRLMFTYGMGRQQLVALGVPPAGDQEVDPPAFIGKRVWVATLVEEFKGEPSLKADIKQLSHAGFQPEADVPAGCEVPVADQTEGVPF